MSAVKFVFPLGFPRAGKALKKDVGAAWSGNFTPFFEPKPGKNMFLADRKPGPVYHFTPKSVSYQFKFKRRHAVDPPELP